MHGTVGTNESCLCLLSRWKKIFCLYTKADLSCTVQAYLIIYSTLPYCEKKWQTNNNIAFFQFMVFTTSMCTLDQSRRAKFPIGWTGGGGIYFWPIKRLNADFRVSYCLVGRVEFHSWPIKRVLEVFWVSYWLAGRGAINSCPIKTLQYSWGLLNFLLAIDGRRGNLFLTN